MIHNETGSSVAPLHSQCSDQRFASAADEKVLVWENDNVTVNIEENERIGKKDL